MVARRPPAPAACALDRRDCSTCALSTESDALLCCTHEDVAVPESPVQTWRSDVADLDAQGWPETVSAPCPAWVAAWGDE